MHKVFGNLLITYAAICAVFLSVQDKDLLKQIIKHSGTNLSETDLIWILSPLFK